MNAPRSQLVGKTAYALAFCVFLPIILTLWAGALDRRWIIDPTALKIPWQIAPVWGWLIFAAGMAFVSRGMFDLWRYGQGLPMNAYPPNRFVQVGAFRLFKHPIYCGAAGISAGLSIAFQSSAGFHVVTPTLVLGMVALVWGYEGPNLRKRFGQRSQAFFSTESHPIGVFVTIFLPWLLAYQWQIAQGDAIGLGKQLISTKWVWFDEHFVPLVPWHQLFYAAAYPFVFSCLFACVFPNVDNENGFAARKRFLKQVGRAGMWTAAVGLFLQIVLPFYAPPRLLEPTNFWSEWILWERRLDGPTGAFPSFHVIWAYFAGQVWILRIRAAQGAVTKTAITNLREYLIRGLVLMIAVSCMTTGAHTLVDVVAGYIVGLGCWNYQAIARYTLKSAEMVANYWRTWIFGPVRIFNHAFYAGGAALLGFFAMSATGVPMGAQFTILIVGLIGAAFWGQLLEGSERLKRPFGYFGSVIGVAAALLPVAVFFGEHWLRLGAAWSLAAPIIQGIGRLRCLVQGCCHGCPLFEGEQLGIRHTRPESRVATISGFSGRLLHATALYSMVGNAITAVVIWRLVWQGAGAASIIAAYLILNNAFRFVEESYRGEVQTRVIGGLRIYQWMALIGFGLGIGFTLIPGPALTFVGDIYDAFLGNFGWSVAAALICGIALGVDFPRSQRRFSRLAGLVIATSLLSKPFILGWPNHAYAETEVSQDKYLHFGFSLVMTASFMRFGQYGIINQGDRANTPGPISWTNRIVSSTLAYGTGYAKEQEDARRRQQPLDQEDLVANGLGVLVANFAITTQPRRQQWSLALQPNRLVAAVWQTQW